MTLYKAPFALPASKASLYTHSWIGKSSSPLSKMSPIWPERETDTGGAPQVERGRDSRAQIGFP